MPRVCAPQVCVFIQVHVQYMHVSVLMYSELSSPINSPNVYSLQFVTAEVVYGPTCLVSTLKGTRNPYFISEVLTISTG